VAAALLASAIVTVADRHGVFVAAGADSYGYVSQANLWAHGQLRVPQPIVRRLPADLTDAALSPLGYRPAAIVGLPGAIVPTYPPGFPIVMAAFQRIGGAAAVYAVVPLLAGLTVWMTFVLGRRLGGGTAGLLSALLLATSPTFVANVLRPMADLPAAAWWTLALLAASHGMRWSAAVAGIATALAILTRPNLALLALVPAAGIVWDWWSDKPERALARHRVVTFLATAAIGPLVVAALNTFLYGSPLRSGYGALADLYALPAVPGNAARYGSWLLQTQSPIVVLALLAPVFGRRLVASAFADAPARMNLAWMSLAMMLAVIASYLPYESFDSWTYLRFLLPAYPPLAALTAVSLVAIARLAGRWRLPALALEGVFIGWFGVHQIQARDVLEAPRDDWRYLTVGRDIARTLPDQAIIFAMQHSGSVRFYSNRLTVRYDEVRPDRLDSMVRDLRQRGFHSYLVLDDWEEPAYRAQFEGRSESGRLDWAPLAESGSPTRVRIYDLEDHGR
jgi:hypothetical protein